MQRYQILHLDGLCNECGNCGSFCPTAGNPYLDKLTLFVCKEDFADSKNTGFMPLGNGAYRVRLEDGSVVEDLSALPANFAAIIKTVERQYPYLIRTHVLEPEL